MSINKREKRLRIKRGVRSKIKGTLERPRMSVFKSNKNIYVQLIDDTRGYTIVSSSSTDIGFKDKINLEISKSIGKKIGERAIEKGIAHCVFDRNGYPYHGRVKALAEAARETGLKF